MLIISWLCDACCRFGLHLDTFPILMRYILARSQLHWIIFESYGKRQTTTKFVNGQVVCEWRPDMKKGKCHRRAFWVRSTNKLSLNPRNLWRRWSQNNANIRMLNKELAPLLQEESRENGAPCSEGSSPFRRVLDTTANFPRGGSSFQPELLLAASHKFQPKQRRRKNSQHWIHLSTRRND